MSEAGRARTGHERAVKVHGLSHHFVVGGEPRPALGPIDLRFRPGEFVCLAGPSGCGKTTLLRMVAGFLRPTEGEVRVGDEVVRAPGQERGVVFQQPTLFPWLDVRKNVELGPRLRKVPQEQRAADVARYLELVGLQDFAQHKPYELSGGMQQRVQIARVLANDPDIVLMDEPFGALDAITRGRLQTELLQIWRETRKTILFITHSVDEAVFLGSRVMVMSSRPGRIVLDREVDLPVPDGDLEHKRSTPEYLALCEEVKTALDDNLESAAGRV